MKTDIVHIAAHMSWDCMSTRRKMIEDNDKESIKVGCVQ